MTSAPSARPRAAARFKSLMDRAKPLWGKSRLLPANDDLTGNVQKQAANMPREGARPNPTGATCGSQTGHRVSGRLTNRTKFPSGYMPEFERQATNRAFDSGFNRGIGKLPFGVGFRRFWIEYYPPQKRPGNSRVRGLRARPVRLQVSRWWSFRT